MTANVDNRTFLQRWCGCCCSTEEVVPIEKRKKQLRRARIEELVVTVVDGKLQTAHQRLQSTEVISIKKALHESPRTTK